MCCVCCDEGYTENTHGYISKICTFFLFSFFFCSLEAANVRQRLCMCETAHYMRELAHTLNKVLDSYIAVYCIQCNGIYVRIHTIYR